MINQISSVLTVYNWGLVCILIFFLFTVARFYEQKSGRRTYYMLFLIPIILFAIAAVRYASLAPNIVGDLGGDLMRCIGGVVLGGVGLFLLRLMIGGRS